MATTLTTVGPTELTAAPATLYTVGAGATFIVRLIHVANLLLTPVNFTLSIGADAEGTRFADQRPIAGGYEYDWGGFLAIPAGTVIQGYASVVDAATIILSGTVET